MAEEHMPGFVKVIDGDAEGYVVEGPPAHQFGFRLCLRCGVDHREVRAQFCQPCRVHMAERGDYPNAGPRRGLTL